MSDSQSALVEHIIKSLGHSNFKNLVKLRGILISKYKTDLTIYDL